MDPENEEKTGKAYEAVIAYIKRQILCGNLTQGQKLPPERELAGIIGVSRNSVREAIRTLEILGTVTSTQGAGNFISCNFQKSLFESLSLMFLLQKIDYRQLSELRRALEQQAVSLAAERITPKQIRSLEEIAAAMARGSDETQNAALDKRLHEIISLASGNQLIYSILQALSDVMDLFIKDLRRKIISRSSGGERLQKIHEDIVACLKNGDRNGACKAMGEHFEAIDESLNASENMESGIK